MDVFLSYNHADTATARCFAEGFEREGFSVWWDQRLKSGEAYDEVTEQALKNAKAVVVLWSPRSVVSRWVRAEATIADRCKTMVPVMIEPCERPIMFELTQTAELGHWTGAEEDPAWRSFIGDVKQFIARERLSGTPDLPTVPSDAAKIEKNKAGVRGTAPSLAILPFTNRSRITDDDIFAEGMLEDIVAALSQGTSLRVLAGIATAHLKGGVITDLAKIGSQLGVRYLLEGNVRRVGTDFRVTTQLVEASNGHVLWSGGFGRPLAELSALQEQLAHEVAAALDAKVSALEMERALRKPSDLTAWEAVQRAELALRHLDANGLATAVREARRATVIAPDYGYAHASLAAALGIRYLFQMPDDSAAVAEIRASIDQALLLDAGAPEVLGSVAPAYCWIGMPQEGYLWAQRAIAEAPKSGRAHFCLVIASCMLNQFDECIEQCGIASALMPGRFSVSWVKAWHSGVMMRAGRWAEGEAINDECLAIAPDDALGQHHKAIYCWRDGRKEQGRKIVAALRAGGMDRDATRRLFVRTFVNGPTIDEMMTAVDGLWAESELAQ